MACMATYNQLADPTLRGKSEFSAACCCWLAVVAVAPQPLKESSNNDMPLEYEL